MGYCIEITNSSFSVKTENLGRVLKPLENHGYSLEIDDDGNVTGIDFMGEKMSYCEDEMFKKIAPFVENGSFIEMRGEDGSMWRWVFKDGKCREIKAKTIWPE